MSDSDREEKQVAPIAAEVRDLKIEADSPSEVPSPLTQPVSHNMDSQPATSNGTASPLKTQPKPLSPVKMESPSQSPVKGEREEVVGGDVTLKLEPGKAPKLSRTTSQRIIARPPPLFLDWEDKTEEATSTFQVLPDCVYAAKYLGSTEPALECDCAEEWDSVSKTNHACGEDSDCINRATKMECVGDCGCGSGCQNQRFQLKQYANVTVIKTEKKGYGLRANTDLRAHDFIFEYIGEVINEGAFRRRMHQYDEEGIKHFYFMSLSKGEFVDATKKGNLGRFCNHSCNPNSYVDKWVVGDKLRMGIFAERNIKAGEELVFNYNVDRYGADPQPCYCGEPNCTGFIGGKTQTERATKLSNTTIEALGIDDGDGWDLAVAKKPRKKKQGEDDEEYVDSVQPKALDEAGVTKVMATLMQCKEKWIAVKLLGRIQRCDEEQVRNRIIKMHGYRILKTTLSTWIDDFNVALQVLDILFQFPRITRNKIQDSKIEETVEKLTTCGDERVETKAKEILYIWSQLEVGYRIPRVKRDPAAMVVAPRDDRRRDQQDRSKSKSPSRSPDAPRGPAAPSGPRSNMPQRGGFFGPRPPYRPRPAPFNALPAGWFIAKSDGGQTYYYSASGQVTWQRPTAPAAQPPPPPKVVTHEQRLQEIINSITQNTTPKEKSSASATPQPVQEEPKKEKTERKEKWRLYPEEKQKKLYENTLAPSVQYVMNKFKKQLDRDDLKRLAKEITKTIANSDFKHKRVKDPTKITSDQEKKIKKHVKEFFEKAAAKKKEYDRKKAERKAKEAAAKESSAPPADIKVNGDHDKNKAEEDEKADVSDIELEEEKIEPDSPSEPSPSSSELKRKREESANGASPEDDDAAQSKKLKTETPPPPPPPPPPPAEEMPDSVDDSGFTNDADVSGSFTDEALEAVNGASEYKLEAGDIRDRDSVPATVFAKQEHLDSSALNGHPSPMQLATPPTNGSDEQERNVRAKSHGFEGMNPERLLQLGLTSD
ncbi:histone methyltransferase set2 [Coniosporium apollinis]|uniref:Histone-lysine N-methyltransferase, H3 lysine-36 specific n=1 Tax=Coniosporium apollinis TaxID=61459 RepID=A0ABQ9NUM9_9PEZI|nr:histone methyltransferase set2 [Coniosporium apollinis]